MAHRPSALGRVTVLVLTACLLTACGDEQAAMTVSALKMPPTGAFETLVVKDKSVVEKVAVSDELPKSDRVVMESFSRQHIDGSAYWRYWLPDNQQERGVYKVKVTLYTEAPAAETAWAQRYPAIALQGTQTLNVGEASFYLPNKIAGFRNGPVLAEIKAEGAAKDLQAFTLAYAQFVDDQLSH